MEICIFFLFHRAKRLLLTRMKMIRNEFADVCTIDTTAGFRLFCWPLFTLIMFTFFAPICQSKYVLFLYYHHLFCPLDNKASFFFTVPGLRIHVSMYCLHGKLAFEALNNQSGCNRRRSSSLCENKGPFSTLHHPHHQQSPVG